jgi:hypothetical protein
MALSDMGAEKWAQATKALHPRPEATSTSASFIPIIAKQRRSARSVVYYAHSGPSCRAFSRTSEYGTVALLA